MIEKIFSRLVGRDVLPGEVVKVRPDRVLLNDVLSVGAFETVGSVAEPSKVTVVVDHGLPVPIVKIPGTGVEVSTHERDLVKFAERFSLRYEFGTSLGYELMGREAAPGELVLGLGRNIATLGVHGALGLAVTKGAMAALLESGEAELCVPEEYRLCLTGKLGKADARDAALWMRHELDPGLIAGKVLVLCGPALRDMNAGQRASLLNLAPELGALSALVSDEAADCEAVLDLSGIKPLVALPGSLEQIVPLGALDGAVKLDVGFIGGCGGGHIEQLRRAAEIFRGKRVGYGMRVIVSPVDRETYYQAMEEGLVDIFLDAGAYFMNPACLGCTGLCAGHLSPGEVCLGTGCFNATGCMGPADSRVYLASAETVAKGCVAGELSKELEGVA